jgi:hypothetical protein
MLLLRIKNHPQELGDFLPPRVVNSPAVGLVRAHQPLVKIRFSVDALAWNISKELSEFLNFWRTTRKIQQPQPCHFAEPQEVAEQAQILAEVEAEEDLVLAEVVEVGIQASHWNSALTESGYGNRDNGPPDTVQEMGTFTHACEGELICESTNVKIPYFNAPIYLENKVSFDSPKASSLKLTLSRHPLAKSTRSSVL